MNGNFTAGERLTEMSLSKKFGVSRTPLRQALEQLVSEGYLPEISLVAASSLAFL